MKQSNFWPLVDNSEEEIYENVAWDLPGFRSVSRRRKAKSRARSSRRSSAR